jgi:vacuolar-type H+-ATPase subunit I/STV1
MKYCKKCDTTKPLSCFSKYKKAKDGLQFYCKDCCKATTKKYREANKEQYYESAKRWARENPERVRESKRKRYLARQEEILQQKKEYYRENREAILEYKKTYGQVNRGKRNAIEAKRHAEKLKRTPDWLTKDHLSEIESFYWLARDLFKITGERYHVDHIVPLQGENVLGLHVPWNLQVLPADLNIAKGNKYDPDSGTA